MISDKSQVCKCRHHYFVPVLIIMIGLVVILGGVDVFTTKAMYLLVGILAIIIGTARMFEKNCACC